MEHFLPGWFVIWKMFLIKFPLIRELVNGSVPKSEKIRMDDSVARKRRNARLGQQRMPDAAEVH